MPVLDKSLQQTLLTRLQALSPEKLQAFDVEIGPNAAKVMLYDLMPELDFLLLEHIQSLKGHQYDPSQVLGGKALEERMAAQQQQGPQAAPQQGPQVQAGGGLGGISEYPQG
jgi:hypothetical protein